MINHKHFTQVKFEENPLCEDYSMSDSNMVAVADGAGGVGLFSDKWSEYLIKNIPRQPLVTFEEFDNWLDGIWEAFYNQYEQLAKEQGALELEKFYDEGAYSTLAAIWKLDASTYQWVTYGDSVAFCYYYDTNVLEFSFEHIADFARPPFLINCKDPLEKDGFKSGYFKPSGDAFLFVATDALAHYIMMIYMMMNAEKYSLELESLCSTSNRYSNLYAVSSALKNDNIAKLFEKITCKKSWKSLTNSYTFRSHLASLYRKGLISCDDYSISALRHRSE